MTRFSFPGCFAPPPNFSSPLLFLFPNICPLLAFCSRFSTPPHHNLAGRPLFFCPFLAPASQPPISLATGDFPRAPRLPRRTVRILGFVASRPDPPMGSLSPVSFIPSAFLFRVSLDGSSGELFFFPAVPPVYLVPSLTGPPSNSTQFSSVLSCPFFKKKKWRHFYSFVSGPPRDFGLRSFLFSRFSKP